MKSNKAIVSTFPRASSKEQFLALRALEAPLGVLLLPMQSTASEVVAFLR